MKLSSALSLLAFCGVFDSASANDSLATVASDEIQYTKSKDIIMNKEVLKISKDQIEVEYEFLNPTDKDITSDVAFPLPPFEYQSNVVDEDYIARKLLEENPGADQKKIDDPYFNNRNAYSYVSYTPFLNFKRFSMGKEELFNTRVIAMTPEGKDITALLKKNDIPLSSLYVGGWMEEGWMHKNPALEKKLKTLKLLDKEGRPNWKTQTVYYWKDTFPSGKPHIVKHTYKPASGQNWAIVDLGKKLNSFEDIELKFGSKGWPDYCVSDDFKKELVESLKAIPQDESRAVKAYEVAYILSTGANWNGPIRDFRLEITPPKETLTAFCPVGEGKVQKTSDGKYVMEMKNFTPTKELRVLFVSKKRPE